MTTVTNLTALLLTLVMSSGSIYATHIRAAEITYKRVSDTRLTYEFTLTGYTDTGSVVRFGDGMFNFGDGSMLPLDQEADSFEDGIFLGQNNEVEQYIIKITHTYRAPGTYIVSYREPNRNDEIVNINKGNSVQTPFYLQALLLADPFIGPNSSPVPTTYPIDNAFVGVRFSHNPWILDMEGDSLAYRLVFPLQDERQVVPNFALPDHPDFYVGTEYVKGNESGTGPAAFVLNPITGDLVWDAPGDFLSNSSGDFSEYNVAFIVEEWREVGGQWKLIGYITRDMQIIVSPQHAGRPDFELPGEDLISVGKPIEETIEFSDPDGQPIGVEFFGSIFQLNNGSMTITPQPDGFQNGPITFTLNWEPGEAHISDRPYLVHLKVTDQPSDQDDEPAVTYKTWILSFKELTSTTSPGISMPPDQDIITGLDDPDNVTELVLYPNPVEYTLHWQTLRPLQRSNKEITIYNILGQQTFLANSTSSLIDELPVSHLASGLYFIELLPETGNMLVDLSKNSNL